MKPINRPSPTTTASTRAITDRVDVYLAPGHYVVGDRRHRIHTLLGSCVSIALWAPRHRVGALCHFLLASRGQDEGAARRHRPDARYGDEALQLMLEALAALGVGPERCEAKVFGGGDMFPGRMLGGGDGVGRRNGEAARHLLEQRGIPLRSESLFGNGHRRIIFDVATGDVWASQTELAIPPSIAQGARR